LTVSRLNIIGFDITNLRTKIFSIFVTNIRKKACRIRIRINLKKRSNPDPNPDMKKIISDPQQ
jgi:hypothetical protein